MVLRFKKFYHPLASLSREHRGHRGRIRKIPDTAIDIHHKVLEREHPWLELPGSSSVASVLSRERSERVVKFLKPLRATATSHVPMENRLMDNRMRVCARAFTRLMQGRGFSGTGTGT
jgi:hypothetical protein